MMADILRWQCASRFTANGLHDSLGDTVYPAVELLFDIAVEADD